MTQPTHCNCICGCTDEFTPEELRYYEDSDVDTCVCRACAIMLQADLRRSEFHHRNELVSGAVKSGHAAPRSIKGETT